MQTLNFYTFYVPHQNSSFGKLTNAKIGLPKFYLIMINSILN